MSDKYDAAIAEGELDRVVILVQHFLRHIRHNEDYATACAYKSRLFKLEADARRVHQELKEKRNG